MAVLQMQVPATSPTSVFEQRFVVAPEPARAGEASMRLQAVRECGRVVDFVWQSASQAAAHLLHREPQALLGLRLRQVIVAGRRGHPTLTDRYRRVLEEGKALAFNQAQLFQGWQEILIHRVVPAGDGVMVSLTSLSANRRAQIARLQASAV